MTVKTKLNTESIKKLGNFGKSYQVNIGIVEKQTHSDGVDMAFLQATHHYGVISQNLPSRDPYIIPLQDNKDKVMQDIQPFMQKASQEFDEVVAYEGIGKQVLENVVKEAFRTGGFGKWEALSQTTINRKGHDTILVDKGESLNAQSFKVIPK